MKSRILYSLLGVFVLCFILVFTGVIASQVERSQNKVLPHKPYEISIEANRLHQSLIIGDLHADSTLWARDLLEESNFDHVALGSDYDGTIEVAFDVSELAVLTHEMLKAKFSEIEIRKIMGENMMRFLADNLPED